MTVKENKAFRRKRIVDAARKIIYLKGIESLTTREIAKGLNLTNGALYRHFKSKNEVLRLLVEDTEETLLLTIKEAAKTKEDPLEKLEQIFLSQISYSERVKATSFVIMNEVAAIKDKPLQRQMLHFLNQYLKVIKEIIIEGQNQGLFLKKVNPSSASLVFLGMMQMMVTLWRLSEYKLSLRKNYFAETFEVFKASLLK